MLMYLVRRFAVIAGLAAAMLTLPVTSDTADARRGYRGGHHVRYVKVYRPRYYRAVRVYRPAHYYYAGPIVRVGSCEWLRRRAIVTGAPYWWRRYRVCRGGW